MICGVGAQVWPNFKEIMQTWLKAKAAVEAKAVATTTTTLVGLFELCVADSCRAFNHGSHDLKGLLW